MANASNLPQLLTAGVIGRELGQPLHRIQHVLRTRQHIRPVARAGQLRLFDRAAVAMIRHELNAIDARRDGGSELPLADQLESRGADDG